MKALRIKRVVDVPCVNNCGSVRHIDLNKQTVAQYLQVSPKCRKCRVRDPEIREKISKGWFKNGGSGFTGRHCEETKKRWSEMRKGVRQSPATEFKKGGNKGKLNVKWKGEAVGYFALHAWVGREKGKPTLCEFCGTRQGRLEWANKSREYKRDLSDWLSLCKKCHGEYDAGAAWGAATKKYGLCV